MWSRIFAGCSGFGLNSICSRQWRHFRAYSHFSDWLPIRFALNCERGYKTAVRKLNLTTLSTNSYAEEKVGSSPILGTWTEIPELAWHARRCFPPDREHFYVAAFDGRGLIEKQPRNAATLIRLRGQKPDKITHHDRVID